MSMYEKLFTFTIVIGLTIMLVRSFVQWVMEPRRAGFYRAIAKSNRRVELRNVSRPW